MRIHKSQILLSISVFLFASEIKAQQISQLGLSNYGMVHSVHLNPSMPAYSNYLWQINVAGFWVNANNNYFSLRMPYSAYRIPNRIPLAYQTESGNPRFDKNWIHENINGSKKHVSVSSQIYGPSFNVKVKTWTFGMFTQASAGVRISRLPENLAHAIFRELDSTQGAFSLMNTYQEGGVNLFNKFSVGGNSNIQLGINAAKSIKIDWGRQVLLGISIKKVWGTPGFYMNSSGMEVRTVTNDSMVFSPTKMQLITYGEETGKGWGTDIGATYVFHKKDSKRNGNYAKTRTKYFSKIGLSIMDIGRVKYKQASYSELSLNNETGVRLSDDFSSHISNNDDYVAVADSFMSQFGDLKQYNADLNVGLATRIVASSDFQIKKHFFVAALVSQSLRKKMSVHSRNQSFLMVAPRLEYKYFEVSLPALLEYDYRSFRLGASFRIGPLYIGTNSLASFVYTKGLRDADIFAGIAFGNLEEFSFRKQAKARKQKKSNQRQNCGVF